MKENNDSIVPVVFFKDKYFAREKQIKQNLENEIKSNNTAKTLELNIGSENHDKDIKKFSGLKPISVFIAGLLNGINPCSMSMILFLLSLITIRSTNVMKVGLVFCLGTIFFNLLSVLNLGVFNRILKIFMIAIITIIVIFNIRDYLSAKKEEYGKITLQLPNRFRKFNHKMMKKVSNINNGYTILIASFILGMVISLGEFLCTGQIYLATIITMLQTNSTLNLQCLTYFIIYDLAFITPLLILTFVIYKGKEVFEVSETIRLMLPLIKLINAGIFLIFGIIILILF